MHVCDFLNLWFHLCNVLLHIYHIDTIFDLHDMSLFTLNLPIKYAASSKDCKSDTLLITLFDSVLLFVKNIDCGFTLEPPRWF